MKEKIKVPTRKPTITEKPYNPLEILMSDYGITKIGEKEFSVKIGEITYSGSLSYVVNLAKGESTDSLWGNP